MTRQHSRYGREFFRSLLTLLLMLVSLAACNIKSIHVPPEDILCRDPAMENGGPESVDEQVQIEKPLESAAVQTR